MRKRKKLISRTMTYVTDYCSRHNYAKHQRRAPRAKPTPVSMEKSNKRNAEIKLRLLIDNNFKAGDYYLTLTFKKAVDWEEAKKAIQKFNRSMRRKFKAKDVPYKYIYVAEGKSRIHFHLLINHGIKLYPNDIRQCWPHGLFEIKMYQGESEDAKRLASYFVKEERTYKNKNEAFHRRWNSSTNLEKPKEKVEIMKSDFWSDAIKAPAGYYLDKDSLFEGVTMEGYPFRVYQLIKIRGDTSDNYDRRKTKVV